MSSLKSFAICLPALYALVAVLAGFMPHPAASIITVLVLCLVAAFTPAMFSWFLGRTFMLDDEENTFLNPILLVIMILICFALARNILPPQWPIIAIAVLATAYVMWEVWYEQAKNTQT